MSSPIRVRPSRIDRLLRGMAWAGRYAAPPAVAMMLGCVPTMRMVSLSPDGRYAAIPYEQKVDGGKDRVVFALVDLETGSGRVTDVSADGAWWYSNTRDVIVSTKPDADPPSVRVVTKEGTKTITQGMLPALSPDGRHVVYTYAEENEPTAHGNLMRYDVKTGETTDLGVSGIFASFSPDGKRLLYASKPGDPEDKGAWRLMAAGRDGGDEIKLGLIDPETAKLFCPAWVDNEHVVFRTRTEKSPKDGELFIADLKGKREQVTDNALEDINPQVVAPDRIVYAQAFDAKSQDVDEHKPVEVWLAEKKDGQWRHRGLGVKACFFAANDKWLVYAGESGEFFRMPLDDPSKAQSLSEMIAKQKGAR